MVRPSVFMTSGDFSPGRYCDANNTLSTRDFKGVPLSMGCSPQNPAATRKFFVPLARDGGVECLAKQKNRADSAEVFWKPVMNLDEAQRKKVAAWIAEGLKLSEIQNRLASELDVRLTYMDVRLLVDDLKLTPKDQERP